MSVYLHLCSFTVVWAATMEKHDLHWADTGSDGLQSVMFILCHWLLHSFCHHTTTKFTSDPSVCVSMYLQKYLGKPFSCRSLGNCCASRKFVKNVICLWTGRRLLTGVLVSLLLKHHQYSSNTRESYSSTNDGSRTLMLHLCINFM